MKYTIELEDIGNGLYKAKGFNTLVFDQNGIDKLEPVEATKVTDEFPQIGDEYFCICGDGHVFKTKVIDDDLDANRMAIGNVFRTQEEAKFAVEKLRVIAELKKYAEPKNRKWTGMNAHYWYAVYDIFVKKIILLRNDYCKYLDIYFKSKEDAEKAIEAVGEERLKKYYFEVDE